ncbi:type II toxin-antitoxin system VapC family toxin [Aurantimonas sp. E1-2-R+4]|uniref:type II toxin-antitoxin system VapC family toxin n=1 Tax=Aurantimonas sp. E1-2-R+4 TaxID=3113714 RepID=UPI002F93DA64
MILIDTHVLIWLLGDDPKLGDATRDIIGREAGRGAVAISAITPWEIALLTQKGRLSLATDVGLWIDAALSRPSIRLLPLEPSIAVASVSLPGSFHPDPADRFIVATARHHGIRIATVDRAILSYGAEGHVRVIDAAK